MTTITKAIITKKYVHTLGSLATFQKEKKRKYAVKCSLLIATPVNTGKITNNEFNSFEGDYCSIPKEVKTQTTHRYFWKLLTQKENYRWDGSVM